MGLIQRQLNRKVSKREKTKQRQNENSTLCCVNICCPCYVTARFIIFYTSINSLYNKNINNCIKGNLYNKSTNNCIKGNLYNKRTNYNRNRSNYNKRTNYNKRANYNRNNNS